MKRVVRASEWDYLVDSITRMTAGYRKNHEHITLQDDYFTIKDNIATSRKTGIQYQIKVGKYFNDDANGVRWVNIYRLCDGYRIKLGYSYYHTLDNVPNMSYDEVDEYIANYEAGATTSYNSDYKEDEKLIDIIAHVDTSAFSPETLKEFQWYLQNIEDNRHYVTAFIRWINDEHIQ